MDGWSENSGGNSQGDGPIAPFSCSPHQQRFLSSGSADLGSCAAELVIRQLMVGNSRQPATPPPQAAVERATLGRQAPPGCRQAL